MRIVRLHLENFRKHADSTLEIGDAAFVVVRGKNFAGKSSIGQALSMCLTPTTSGLDEAGKNYESKIKRGESKAVITADIQGKQHLIQRVVTLNTNSSGRTRRSICLDDPDWTPTAFDRQLEEKKAVLTVILNTDAFLRMSEDRQKNLLAGLALPKRYDWDREIMAKVESVLPGEINFDDEPFAVIREAYKLLYDERQIVNRQVREFVTPEELPVPVGVDSISIQNQLTTLRITRRDRDSQRMQAVQEATVKHVEREKAKAKAQVYADAIADEERRAVSIRAFLLSDERRGEFLKLAAGREELDALKKEKAEIEAALDEHLRCAGRLEELKLTAPRMFPDEPAGNAVCPTCYQSIDKVRLEEMSNDEAAAIHEAKEYNQSVFDKIKALSPVEEAIAEIDKYDGAVKELADIEARVTEKRRLLKAMQDAMPEPVLFDFAPYEQSLAECDQEIERLMIQLRPVIAAEERWKEVAVKREQLSKLKERATVLDALTKYFDKDGIKAKLIGEYIGGFETKLNEVLSAWGYACALSMEPYSFNVTNADGDTVPLRELSGAERVMFSLAFQCAVSRTANMGLVVIDEVAMFLPEIRPLLNKRLYEMLRNGYLEQAIMLVADSSEQVPTLPGAVFFMVSHGTVRELRNRELDSRPLHPALVD